MYFRVFFSVTQGGGRCDICHTFFFFWRLPLNCLDYSLSMYFSMKFYTDNTDRATTRGPIGPKNQQMNTTNIIYPIMRDVLPINNQFVANQMNANRSDLEFFFFQLGQNLTPSVFLNGQCMWVVSPYVFGHPLLFEKPLDTENLLRKMRTDVWRDANTHHQ